MFYRFCPPKLLPCCAVSVAHPAKPRDHMKSKCQDSRCDGWHLDAWLRQSWKVLACMEPPCNTAAAAVLRCTTRQ